MKQALALAGLAAKVSAVAKAARKARPGQGFLSLANRLGRLSSQRSSGTAAL